jgi:hypothetical protein
MTPVARLGFPVSQEQWESVSGWAWGTLPRDLDAGMAGVLIVLHRDPVMACRQRSVGEKGPGRVIGPLVDDGVFPKTEAQLP